MIHYKNTTQPTQTHRVTECPCACRMLLPAFGREENVSDAGHGGDGDRVFAAAPSDAELKETRHPDILDGEFEKLGAGVGEGAGGDRRKRGGE